MKHIFQFLLLITTSIFLWGCPYDSPYGIDAVAQEGIDESLLGSWAAIVTKPGDDMHHREGPVKIIFSKNTDQEYNIAITGNIDELKPYHVITNDTIKGTAWLSTIANKQFLNSFVKGRVYIAEVKKEAGGLSILCLAERFTAKYIKSSDELRKAVTFHYKVAIKPGYDDYFVLKNLQKVN